MRWPTKSPMCPIVNAQGHSLITMTPIWLLRCLTETGAATRTGKQSKTKQSKTTIPNSLSIAIEKPNIYNKVVDHGFDEDTQQAAFTYTYTYIWMSISRAVFSCMLLTVYCNERLFAVTNASRCLSSCLLHFAVTFYKDIFYFVLSMLYVDTWRSHRF